MNLYLSKYSLAFWCHYKELRCRIHCGIQWVNLCSGDLGCRDCWPQESVHLEEMCKGSGRAKPCWWNKEEHSGNNLTKLTVQRNCPHAFLSQIRASVQQNTTPLLFLNKTRFCAGGSPGTSTPLVSCGGPETLCVFIHPSLRVYWPESSMSMFSIHIHCGQLYRETIFHHRQYDIENIILLLWA